MKPYCIFFLLFFLSYYAKAQELTSYEAPHELRIFSKALNDSVLIEITLPKDLVNQTTEEYPIIYLLDRQLENNYKYNLSTIDYLSTLQWMPNAIVVGVTFPRKNRNSWTNPNKTGGKADNLIEFISKELNHELKKKYPVSNFNLLIGHSRTAIFSSYALSKKPDFFNGAIASSVSNFDFGDTWQKQQFEIFLSKIGSVSHKYYYYFSVGEKAYGDLHESAVDALNVYLKSRKVPTNFEWKYYKHKIAHDLTPGLTVNQGLSEIFKDYGRRINVCFDLAKASTDKVPWKNYLDLYSSISTDLEFKIEPSEFFFNSIASDYYNDYNGIYGDKKLDFTLEILFKAIEKYPNEFSYYSWIGEIYFTLKNFEKGKDYLNKAIERINMDRTLSEPDRMYYLQEIEALKNQKN